MTRLLPLLLLAACQGNAMPAAARDHQARGDKALTAGDAEAALVAYNHARELAPTDPALQDAAMRARVYLFAEDPLRINNVPEARYETTVLLESNKISASVGKTALANLAFREGDTTLAEKLLGEAVAADGKERLAHRALGMLLGTRREDATRARSELEAALAISAADPPATRALAQLLIAQGETSAAVALLDKGLVAKEDGATRLLLCRVKEGLKDDPATMACYRELTQKQPQMAEAWASLGQLSLTAGELAPAERALRRSLELRADPQVGTALGFALSRQNKHAEAMPLFQELLVRDPNAALVLYGAATTSEGLGKLAEARAYYGRLAAVPASDAMSTNLRGEAQARLRALDGAEGKK